MRGSIRKGRGSVRDHRRELAERLRERSGELEDAIFDRICAMEESLSGHHQLQGLRGVIRPAVEHGLVAVELGEQRAPEPPPALIAHARKAAWQPVSLHALLEHYLAGYSVFQHFLLRESPSVDAARQAQASLDVVFHRLRRALSDEHTRELQKRNRSSDLRKLERVQGLLSGELLEAPELHYPFDGAHVSIVASGPEISSTIRRLFQPLGSQLLLVTPAPNRVWAWIHRQEMSPTDIDKQLGADLPPHACISIGEPGEGVAGWRLTHRQALTARSFALRGDFPVVQYSEVALLASTLEDEALVCSLTRRYLEPLASARGGGTALRETLRAYFASQRQTSSAAQLLGIKRHTVASRLQTAENALNRNLNECAAELELALQLQTLA
jgi:hypothetical protein